MILCVTLVRAENYVGGITVGNSHRMYWLKLMFSWRFALRGTDLQQFKRAAFRSPEMSKYNPAHYYRYAVRMVYS